MEALEEGAEIILLANNDIKVHPEIVDYAVRAFQSSSNVGFVGCNVFELMKGYPKVITWMHAINYFCSLTEEKEFIDGMALFAQKSF